MKANEIKPLRRRMSVGAAAACGLLALPGLVAQEESADDEIFELSPFVITAAEDSGYVATSTLSGTRLRSNLGDIASSISVVTAEFLEDTAATNAEELLVYTTGTEVKGPGGNLALPGAAFRGVSEDNSRTDFGAVTRVRGLAGADRTRNLFQSDIPFDAYNTNRIEINRGANAALFGLGSPAGIINQTVKNAEMYNTAEVEMRVDSLDGYRGSFDINREALEDELAIRVAGLYDQTRYEQEEAFRKDERLYLAATYTKDLAKASELVGKTTLRANFETIAINENRPNVLPPVDGITHWFTGFEHEVVDAVVTKGTWRNNTDAEHFWAPSFGATPNPRQQFWVIQGASSRGPMVVVPEPDAMQPFAGMVGNTPIVGRQPVINNGVQRPDGSYATAILVAPTLLPEALNFSRSPAVPEWTLYTSPTLRDTSVFDFRNHMLLGPNRPATSDFEVYNVTLEQLFFGNKLGIEMAIDEQTARRDTFELITSGITHRVYIDINETVADGSPNPNFGRPFAAGQSAWSENQSDRRAERLTGFITHDFRDNSEGLWARLLGRQTFTGTYSRQEVDSLIVSGGTRVNADFVYGRNNNTTAADWQVPIFVYLGPDISSRNTAAGASISPIAREYRINDDFIGGGQFYFRGQNPGDTPRLSQVTFDDRWVGNGDKTRQEIDSTALIWQGFLLNDLVVPTVSWRRDDVESIVTGAPNKSSRQEALIEEPAWILENYALFNGNRNEAEGESTSWGVVVKAPLSWMEKVPVIDSLSALYNESSNFQVTGGRRDVFGNSIEPPTGENEEYGIRMDLLDQKLSINAISYETSQSNISFGGGFSLSRLMSSLVRVIEPTVLGRNPDADGDFLPENAAGAEISLPENLLDFTSFSISSTGTATFTIPVDYASVRDVVSEGKEIEVIYNPTKQWRMAVNVAQQKAQISNVQVQEKRLWEETTISVGGTQKTLREAWTNDFANLVANTNNVPAPQGGLRSEFSDELTNTLAAGQALNGQKAPELREWRVNLITNYAFSEGRLNGWSFGGAARWEDDVAIGGPVIFLEDGTPVTDIENPFFGPSEFKLDLWAGYETRIFHDAVDWSIKLNVRNALDEDDLVPIIANPDGFVAVHRIPAGRSFELTSNFRF